MRKKCLSNHVHQSIAVSSSSTLLALLVEILMKDSSPKGLLLILSMFSSWSWSSRVLSVVSLLMIMMGLSKKMKPKNKMKLEYAIFVGRSNRISKEMEKHLRSIPTNTNSGIIYSIYIAFRIKTKLITQALNIQFLNKLIRNSWNGSHCKKVMKGAILVEWQNNWSWS